MSIFRSAALPHLWLAKLVQLADQWVWAEWKVSQAAQSAQSPSWALDVRFGMTHQTENRQQIDRNKFIGQSYGNGGSRYCFTQRAAVHRPLGSRSLARL